MNLSSKVGWQAKNDLHQKSASSQNEVTWYFLKSAGGQKNQCIVKVLVAPLFCLNFALLFGFCKVNECVTSYGCLPAARLIIIKRHRRHDIEA